MTSPLVSVIMPAYNAAPYLQAAIESVLCQTYPHFELIIINDGSTDGTEAAAHLYLTDRRMRYIYQKNGGISRARNRGAAEAQGEYLAFLDADDLALPNRLQEQVRSLEQRPDYGVAYSQFQSFRTGQPNVLHTYVREGRSGDILAPLLRHSFICPSTVMLRRTVFETVGGFDKEFRDAEDWDLWRRLAYGGVKFFYIEMPLVRTRLHAQSLSGFHNQVRMKRMNLLSFEHLFSRMTDAERQRYGADGILRTLKLKLAIAYLLLGSRTEFRLWLANSRVRYRWCIWPLSLVPPWLMSWLIRRSWQYKQDLLFRRTP